MELPKEWYADGASVDSYAGSWSMAKSFTSALVGIALDGSIPSLDVPIASYGPSWAGIEKEAITLRTVLTMSSGLDWKEGYPSSTGDSDVIAVVTSTGPHLPPDEWDDPSFLLPILDSIVDGE